MEFSEVKKIIKLTKKIFYILSVIVLLVFFGLNISNIESIFQHLGRKNMLTLFLETMKYYLFTILFIFFCCRIFYYLFINGDKKPFSFKDILNIIFILFILTNVSILYQFSTYKIFIEFGLKLYIVTQVAIITLNILVDNLEFIYYEEPIEKKGD